MRLIVNISFLYDERYFDTASRIFNTNNQILRRVTDYGTAHFSRGTSALTIFKARLHNTRLYIRRPIRRRTFTHTYAIERGFIGLFTLRNGDWYSLKHLCRMSHAEITFLPRSMIRRLPTIHFITNSQQSPMLAGHAIANNIHMATTPSPEDECLNYAEFILAERLSIIYAIRKVTPKAHSSCAAHTAAKDDGRRGELWLAGANFLLVMISHSLQAGILMPWAIRSHADIAGIYTVAVPQLTDGMASRLRGKMLIGRDATRALFSIEAVLAIYIQRWRPSYYRWCSIPATYFLLRRFSLNKIKYDTINIKTSDYDAGTLIITLLRILHSAKASTTRARLFIAAATMLSGRHLAVCACCRHFCHTW